MKIEAGLEATAALEDAEEKGTSSTVPRSAA